MNSQDNVSRLIDAGTDSYDRGDYESALDAFVKVVDAGAVEYRINVGNTLSALGRTAEAIMVFRIGWELGDPDIGWNLAAALHDLGEVDEARRVEDDLFKRQYPAAVVNEAWNRREAGDAEGAARLLRSVLAESGMAGDWAAGVLGMWLRQDGDLGAETEALLRRGMKEYEDARVELARLLYAQGHEGQAVLLLEEGVENGEEDSLVPLGNQRWKEGRLDDARDLFARGADLGDVNAAENLASLMRAIVAEGESG